MAADDPNFEAEVDRLHALFLAGMEELFDTFKGIYGWENMPLQIE